MKREIEIKDIDSLIKILKVISWLDYRRWKTGDNYNFISFYRNEKDYKNIEKILIHWICYITDRQIPYENVWNKGGKVFSELVYDYSRDNTSPKELLDKYYRKKGYDKKKSKPQFEFKSPTVSQNTFASRYIPEDYENIKQTLEVLSQEYEKNIVKFISKIINSFRDEEDLLMRVACALHLLTYQLGKNKKANSEETIKILNDPYEFNKKLKKFINTSTENKKRLWCCVGDYKKGLYNEIFEDAIKDEYDKDSDDLINIWNKLPMHQIELPGDVWNNNPFLRDNLFANVLNIESIPKQWKMPKIIRVLYNQLKDYGKIDDFYPEQFDITFDFVPRMCSKKNCNVCFFGKNGVKSICIPTPDKYCPVALITCGYSIECRDQVQKCYIKDNTSKGICKGIEKLKNL